MTLPAQVPNSLRHCRLDHRKGVGIPRRAGGQSKSTQTILSRIQKVLKNFDVVKRTAAGQQHCFVSCHLNGRDPGVRPPVIADIMETTNDGKDRVRSQPSSGVMQRANVAKSQKLPLQRFECCGAPTTRPARSEPEQVQHCWSRQWSQWSNSGSINDAGTSMSQ